MNKFKPGNYVRVSNKSFPNMFGKIGIFIKYETETSMSCLVNISGQKLRYYDIDLSLSSEDEYNIHDVLE